MLNRSVMRLGVQSEQARSPVVWLAVSKFCLQPFLPLGVSGIPNGFVIFDLFFDHDVKDHCDLMGGCHGGSFGTQLGFHSAQVATQGREAVMEGISGHAE